MNVATVFKLSKERAAIVAEGFLPQRVDRNARFYYAVDEGMVRGRI